MLLSDVEGAGFDTPEKIAWMRWCREAAVLFGPSGTGGLLGTEGSCRWAMSLSKQSKIWSKAADAEK